MNNNYEDVSDRGAYISLDTFVGQQKLTELLKVSIAAAKARTSDVIIFDFIFVNYIRFVFDFFLLHMVI